MGSRFIVTPEANAPMELKEALLEATSDETVHTRLYTGRTLRALANPWHAEWEGERVKEMRDLLDEGVVPFNKDAQAGIFGTNHGDKLSIGWWYGGQSPHKWLDRRGPLPEGTELHSMGITVGQGVGALTEIKPAAEVYEQLTNELLDAVSRMPVLSAKAKASRGGASL